MLTLGDEFPDFPAKTTIGNINFHEFLGDSWGILFSHPADFTPVCTTELARVVNLMPEFQKRGVKVIALSCDSVESHKIWSTDILSYAGDKSSVFPYPIIDDSDRKISVLLGMLNMEELDKEGLPMSARAVFVVDPKKKFRLSILYPANVGRNFNEILRAVDGLQLSDKHKIACPVDWQVGDSCIIPPTVSEADAGKLFPTGMTTVVLPSGKSYLRKIPQP